jgi:lysozyme family protein
MNYDSAFDRLIGNEGGYVNNPADPGGETNWGITWPVLHQAIGAGVVTSDVTIASMTRDQAKLIYKAFFWDAGKMDQYNGAIAFQVFDFAVNSGIQTALRKLQVAVGVADDGNVGPATIAAINAMTPPQVIMNFVAARLDFWRKLSTWPTFGAGWAGRAAADLRYGAQDI